MNRLKTELHKIFYTKIMELISQNMRRRILLMSYGDKNTFVYQMTLLRYNWTRLKIIVLMEIRDGLS